MKLLALLIILTVISKTYLAALLMDHSTDPQEVLNYFIAYLLGLMLTAWMCDEYRRIEVKP